jgi:ankyrin repeat protein
MSGSDREPGAPTFERARELAKTLLRECRTGRPAALDRVRAQLPRLAALDPAQAAGAVRLADVQHAIAREGGLESWAALKRHLLALEPLVEQVKRFLRALHEGDSETVLEVLERHPDVARTSLHAACVACDPGIVERWLARDPTQATERLGGKGWTPIECLGASPVAVRDAAHMAASVSIAERLLALGADANSGTPAGDDDPQWFLTALYRASEQGNAPLVRLLLERGADPNDGESVYHAAERDHRDVLEALLAHGAEISAAHARWTNTPLYFLSGYADDHFRAPAATSGMRWLLEHGADPNVTSYKTRETPLHRVTAFGRSPALAEMLLAHGADPRQPRADGRTAYELAVRTGNLAVAELLRARGAASATLRPEDEFLGACARGDFEAARRIREHNPELVRSVIAAEPGAIVRAAHTGNVAAVRALIESGFDLAAELDGAGTALHWVAWHGVPAMARLLVELGAPIDFRDSRYGSSPIAWAAHGSRYCREADEEYIAVIDALLAVKPNREASYNRWGEPPENLSSEPVAEYLRAKGFAPAP